MPVRAQTGRTGTLWAVFGFIETPVQFIQVQVAGVGRARCGSLE